MALVKTENLAAQAKGFGRLPVLRQVGLMIGLAASVALGVAVVLWSKTPDYSLLYGRLSDADAAQVAESLEQAGIPYRIEHGSGIITVPAGKVHEARLKLAKHGLPRSDGSGFELLEKSDSFGTSRFIEQARYHRAIEGELARTISKLQNVESARVHLSIPKHSVFVRDKGKTRASVVLKLFSSLRLDEERLAGIVHLVAASVPGLEADQVTVVDQKGRLLTNSSSMSEVGLSSNQLAYTRRLEEVYSKRIRDILVPVLGEDGVRAQVVAELDFTTVESTTEKFQPDSKVVRSEETFNEETTGSGVSGVPGALTNTPPKGGTIVQDEDALNRVNPVNSTSRATRNFEMDRSISHTRTAPGSLQRLSAAVVVDYLEQKDEKGKLVRAPLGDEEMARITALVKDAIGFDEKRNDSVNVTNISFKAVEEIEPVAAMPVWKEPWVLGIVKQVLGVLMVLLLVFGVLRPVLRNLATRPPQVAALPGGQGADGEQLALAEDQLTLGNQPQAPAISQEQQFGMARNMIENDPQRAAQVVKTWMAADG